MKEEGRMVRRLGVLALVLATVCGAALGQGVALDATPPSRAQVLKLMAVMGVQQNVDDSLRGTQQKLKLQARSSFLKKNPDADAATLKKLDNVFDSTPVFSFESVSEVLIPVYQKHLSASDVEAGIDFYGSEAGKRLLQQTPIIIRESNEGGRELVQQKLAVYSGELERKLEAFQADVAKQKPPTAEGSKAAESNSKTTDEKSK